MDKKIIGVVARNTAKEIVKTLKEYRAAGKNLDDVIAAFEEIEPGDKEV